jgi:hypothetical protein
MRGCGRIERLAFPAPSDFQMADQSKTRVLMRGEIARPWLQAKQPLDARQIKTVHPQLLETTE